jgi:hypothetical protein
LLILGCHLGRLYLARVAIVAIFGLGLLGLLPLRLGCNVG